MSILSTLFQMQYILIMCQIQILMVFILTWFFQIHETGPNDILKSYTGHVIHNIGYTNVDVKFGNQTVNVVFNVVHGDVKPVLGRDTFVSLGLLKHGSLNVNRASKGVNDDMPGVSNVCYSIAAGQTQNERPVENTIPKAKKNVENESDLMGLGQLKRHEYDIALTSNYEAVQNPPQNVQ